MKKIILSGFQPTGQVHLGNYLGSLANFVALQEKYECFFFIADYHSLSENYEPKEKQRQIIDTTRTFLAAGLSPEKSTLYVQSHIPEVLELAWIFNCLTPISYLERMTQYKDKARQQRENVNAGLFDYPVLQAADILLYKADAVPVGEDQVQHVELTRQIARFFNSRFGQYFKMPEALLSKTPRVMSLNDPARKMSKSLGEKSYVALTDEPEIIRQKIMSAVTATSGGGQSAGVKNLFLLLRNFSDPKVFMRFEKEEEERKIKYSELKEQLASDIAVYFADFREKFKKITDNEVIKILENGAAKARPIAQKTLQEVKQKMGLI
ncbi:MAG: tryptophan--tRNA ligase [Patescibacteria group bacterium]